MPLIRKRRAQAEASPPASPPPTRRRRSPSASAASSVDDIVDGNTTLDGETQDGDSSSHQMVKKLVRLALASEYARQPIRRTDITAKVLAPHSGRQFKHIFNSAQQELRKTFGMEMTELPVKEKVTISQKRAAQRAQSTSHSNPSKSYILTSTLPPHLRAPLPPPRIPSTTTESTYTALYTFIISLIYLSSGQLAEGKLDRYLNRCNANEYTPLDKTDKLLKRMEKEGYVLRVRERQAGDEETVSFVVGPRGRVEVGERGAAGVVRRVYEGRGEEEELERRLERSLGVGGGGGGRKVERGQEEEGGREGEGGQVDGEGGGEGGGAAEGPVARREQGRPRRRQRGEAEEADE